MAGMIRLRPTQIILTGEEVNKTLRKSCPVASRPRTSPVQLQWDHNVTFRKGRSTLIVGKAPYFNIHEDSTTTSEADAQSESDTSDGVSEMSNFSFGPILLDINPSGTNLAFVEASSQRSSEAGDESSSEDNTKSSSWHEDYSANMDTLTSISTGSNEETLLPSIFLNYPSLFQDRHQDTAWEIYSDAPVEHESNGAHDSLNDIEYQADVELSAVEDDALSDDHDSDVENCAQEPYSLPMDGAAEHKLAGMFSSLDLYASPASSTRDNLPFQDEESYSSRVSEILDTTSGLTTTTLTPPSVRRLPNDAPPRPEDAVRLSPRDLALQRAIPSRYRSSHLKSLSSARSSTIQFEGDSYHQHLRPCCRRRFSFRDDVSPFRARYSSNEVTPVFPDGPEHSSAVTDESDGGIEIPEASSKAVTTRTNDNQDNVGVSDKGKKEAAQKLDG